jgi:hypothetical protein
VKCVTRLHPPSDAYRRRQHARATTADVSYDKKGDVTRLDYVIYVWKKDPSGKITYAEIE